MAKVKMYRIKEKGPGKKPFTVDENWYNTYGKSGKYELLDEKTMDGKPTKPFKEPQSKSKTLNFSNPISITTTKAVNTGGGCTGCGG